MFKNNPYADLQIEVLPANPGDKDRHIVMKIVVTGTRGIPRVLGGVETHCEELFPRISKMGLDVNLLRRSHYVITSKGMREFNGVKLKTLYAPHLKSFETIVHTFLAVLWARKHKADIIHIHAIGPAILTPLARILGLKVVFTHHGPDYNREKWNWLAKAVLRLGERTGARHANKVIVISRVIQESLIEKYDRKDTHLIFNGVNEPVFTNKTTYIKRIGLVPRRYVFTLGRFVEEKAYDLLIRAFSRIKDTDYQLVISGDSDHKTAYSQKLKRLARANNIILTGFIKGEKLQELFSHAGLFVLPSTHEGLPIGLLEAMSYNLPVLVSNIPANEQVGLPKSNFFESGNEESLIEELSKKINEKFEPVEYNLTPYDWDQIALQTKAIYEQLLK